MGLSSSRVFSLMKSELTISALAKKVAIPSSTIRYYERVGLLRPQGRTSGNYRFYGEDSIERLRFIRAAQATGFTIANITTLLEFRDGVASPCEEVRPIIESRLADVDNRLSEFRHFQQVLKSFLEACRRTDHDDCCPVIEELSLTARSDQSEE